MRKQRTLHCAVVVSLVIGANLLAAPVGGSRQQQPQPMFRSGVTAVPIDVRVIDRDGRPVTDLKQEDFTVFEDDVRQPIVHFSGQVLVERPSGPALRARSEVPGFEGTPQTQRIFLIVLGAGALGTRPLGPHTRLVPDPSKSLDGLLHLLRDRLLPQDQVALLAYNRASDFSADHEKLARVLETFRDSEEGGLAALARQSVPAPVSSPADSVFLTPPAGLSSSSQVELGFAEYVEARNRRTSDLENLHYGIKYLRFMEGEKHLIYVTERGMVNSVPASLPEDRVPFADPKRLAAAASDARVALHIIQTGGIAASPRSFLSEVPVLRPYLIFVPGLPYFGTGGSGAVAASGTESGAGGSAPRQPGWDRPAPDPSVAMPSMSAMDLQALADLRTMAQLTGGHASIMDDAGKAVDRIDAQTRADYLLAYYPSNSVWDGRYRSVRVEVNPPGVTVLFRHGYYGERQTIPLDRRVVVADGRLLSAASSTRELRDIRLSVTPAFTKNPTGKGGELLAQMVIDATRLAWTTDDLSRRVAHLDVAVFCGDAREKIVG
jgi:VWFA-related protein